MVGSLPLKGRFQVLTKPGAKSGRSALNETQRCPAINKTPDKIRKGIIQVVINLN